MNKILVSVLAVLLSASCAFAQISGTKPNLIVKEVDGDPIASNVTTLIVTNDTLTENSNSIVTIDTGGGASTADLQAVTDVGASTDNVLEAAGYDTTRVDAAQYSLWYEPTSAAGDEYFGWQANANITTSYIWVAPAADAAGGLTSNGSGVISIVDYEEEVTEGSLADSTILSADIKNGEIVTGDLSATAGITLAQTAITAGRSLTIATNDIAADAELYTQSKAMTIETPTDADNFFFFVAPQALTITKVTGIVEAATSAVITLQECDAAGDNAATIEAVTADVDGTISTSIDNGAIDAGDVIRVDIGTVTGTVGQAHVTVVFTLDD
jgi:hypothetical protein